MDQTKPGVHVLDNPVTGYKKVSCTYQHIFTREERFGKCIAEVTVPKGATLVRPGIKRTTYNDMDEPMHTSVIPGKKLRTDEYKTGSITPHKPSFGILFTALERVLYRRSACASLHDETFKYEEDTTYKLPDMNKDTTSECSGPGLFFFENRADAESY
jgi:hypothetical protein